MTFAEIAVAQVLREVAKEVPNDTSHMTFFAFRQYLVEIADRLSPKPKEK